MSESPIVPPVVPSNVPARRRVGPPSYLAADHYGWRFQIRIPRELTGSDFVLAKVSPILRVRIGRVSRRVAEQRAALYASVCRAVFALAAHQKEKTALEQDVVGAVAPEDLLAQVVAACQAGIARAMDNPAEAIGLAQDLRGALQTLTLVSEETQKGSAGNAAVVAGADGMVRGALGSVLRHAPDGSQAARALAAVPDILPKPSAVSVSVAAVAAAAETKPKFSQVSAAYIEMREAVSGKSHPDVRVLRTIRQTFLDVIGDRPIDQYFPRDLQDYVNRMKFWPSNSAKRQEFKGLSTLKILELNKSLTLKPMARNTFENKYVAFIKAMARYLMNDHNYRDPFAGAKVRYPDTAARPKVREEIGGDVLNQAFALGIASGCMDEAMLPLLARLTSRRLGLLLYLKGSDIRRKHGVYIAQTDGIVEVEGVWQRVPIKTDDSMSFFVLHDFLYEIGFIDWAMATDGWLFTEPHEHPDPSKYASKVVNRLLRAAGAAGGNVEVFHSLRGDAIDIFRDEGVDERTRRLQAGHEVTSQHDRYGNRSIRAVECRRIASRPLEPDVHWDLFRNLDFAALAQGRRARGRRRGRE